MDCRIITQNSISINKVSSSIPQSRADYQGYTVSGKVLNVYVETLDEQDVLATEVNLRSAAVYKTAKRVEEHRARDGFVFLGNAKTDVDVDYEIAFNSATLLRKKMVLANVVAFAVDMYGNIIGCSALALVKSFEIVTEVAGLTINTSISDIRGESIHPVN